MKRLIIYVALSIFLMTAVPVSADITLTFEEFVGYDVGQAGTPIGTFYSGLTFETLSPGASDWVGRDHNTGSYNTYSRDLHTGYGGYDIYGNGFATTALNTTGNGGKISFDNADASYFELMYSSYGTFYLTAYAANGMQLDQAIGVSNYGQGQGMDLLRVDWNSSDYIAYITVHDTGDFWLIDNLTTDATDIVITPVPGAVLLGFLGLSAAGIKLRKHA